MGDQKDDTWRIKPSIDAITKTKSKHKSLLSFLSREKSSVRRSPRLQDKENDASLLNKDPSEHHLCFKTKHNKKQSSKQDKKREHHQPIIKQLSKSVDTKQQKSLKRMRSSSLSLHSIDTVKPAKRSLKDPIDVSKSSSEEIVQTATLNRRSFRGSFYKVVPFAAKFSPKTTDVRESLNQTHTGEFARPASSPFHNFTRQGSKKYKQLPTPIRRRPSKLWIDTIAHSTGDIRNVLSPLQIKRQEAIFELYSGEDDMVEDLRLLREVYLNPMSTLGLIEEQELQQMFGFIQVLLPLHEDLTKKLRNLKTENDMIDEVGPALLEWVPTLRPYIDYCAKQVLAKELLDKVLKADNGVADFLQRCLESPFSRKLDLWSFMDAPRGRLVKYPLLFNTIKKLTPKDHPDRCLLQRAIYEMERIIEEADTETGRYKCEHVRNQLYFLDPQHASSVNQATSLCCSGLLRNKNGTKVHTFLFDNILVMSRPATRQGRMMFQVAHQPIDIASLSLEDLPDGEVKIGGSFKNTITKSQSTDKHLFRICVHTSPQSRSLTFQAHDDHDKKQWIKNFNSVISKRQADAVKTKICF